MSTDRIERRAAALQGIMRLLAEQVLAEYAVRHAALEPPTASAENVTHDKTQQRPSHGHLQSV